MPMSRWRRQSRNSGELRALAVSRERIGKFAAFNCGRLRESTRPAYAIVTGVTSHSRNTSDMDDSRPGAVEGQMIKFSGMIIVERKRSIVSRFEIVTSNSTASVNRGKAAARVL
jgi:hypothetical protein